MIAPSPSPVTLGYGVYGVAGYTAQNPHAGVDFAHSPDNKIYAPEDGLITLVGSRGACGQAIELTAGPNKHRFCHTSQLLVGQGQRVKKGQSIGVMGQTGQAYGVHLHWILWVDGMRVDGLKYVTEEKDTMTPEEVDIKFQATMNRRATANELKLHTGRPHAALDKEILNSVENKQLRTKAANYKRVEDTLKKEQAEPDELKLQKIEQIIKSNVVQ